MLETTRLGLPYPEGLDVAHGDEQLEALAEVLDDAALITSGTLAARPTPTGTAPLNVYYATDTVEIFLNTGAAWVKLATGAPTAPVGTMVDWGKATAPADTRWALCAGQALSRSTYARLFAEIGTTFGVGDGSTTFNLPDFRGRVAVAPDASAGRLTTNNTVGAAGGAESVAVTEAELPVHTHADTFATDSQGSHAHDITLAGGHAHNYQYASGTYYHSGATWNVHHTGYHNVPTTSVANHTHTLGAAGTHTHTITGAISNAGSGSGHANVMPYLITAKIMRVA